MLLFVFNLGDFRNTTVIRNIISGIVTDGHQEIIARPGERNKFDDGGFQEAEVMKLIEDAKVTKRMQRRYLEQIFEDDEDEEEKKKGDQEGEGEGEEGNNEQSKLFLVGCCKYGLA